MYCIKCGKEIQDDARFCPHCGATTARVAPEHRADAVERHAAAAGHRADAAERFGAEPSAARAAVESRPNAGTRSMGASVQPRGTDTRPGSRTPRVDPSMTTPMPKIALPVEQATVPTVYAPGPVDSADAPTRKGKSKTPLIVAGAVALVVLAGAGAVFALGGFGSHDQGATSVQAVDTGSSSATANKGDAATLPAQNEKPVDNSDDAQEADGAAEADPLAGTADATASLDQTHTYANARFGFSTSIPDRFKVTKVPANNDGLGYTDPATGIKITVSAIRNLGESAAQHLADVDLSGMQDVYTASDDGWYVASWRDGDTIVYEKTLVTDEKCCTMRFEYAYGMRDTGSGLVEALSPSLAFTNDGVQ